MEGYRGDAGADWALRTALDLSACRSVREAAERVVGRACGPVRQGPDIEPTDSETDRNDRRTQYGTSNGCVYAGFDVG